jgi:hypothetical protein
VAVARKETTNHPRSLSDAFATRLEPVSTPNRQSADENTLLDLSDHADKSSSHGSTVSPANIPASPSLKEQTLLPYASLALVPTAQALNDDTLLSSLSGSAIVSRRNKYTQQHNANNLLNIVAGNVLGCIIARESIICILDSGVLETYK